MSIPEPNGKKNAGLSLALWPPSRQSVPGGDRSFGGWVLGLP